jgi:fumarate reductase subunit C
MKGWWLKHPYYIKYMIRESSALFVALYSGILLHGLWCLTKGQSEYEAWLEGLTNPLYIVFHFVAMLLALYHTYTWFMVSPKVVPHIYIGTDRIPDFYISAVQYVIGAVCYLALFVLVVWV